MVWVLVTGLSWVVVASILGLLIGRSIRHAQTERDTGTPGPPQRLLAVRTRRAVRDSPLDADPDVPPQSASN